MTSGSSPLCRGIAVLLTGRTAAALQVTVRSSSSGTGWTGRFRSYGGNHQDDLVVPPPPLPSRSFRWSCQAFAAWLSGPDPQPASAAVGGAA